MSKAKYIGRYKDRNNPYATELLYEYRGMEYSVTAYQFETVETLKSQHEREQRLIDERLDNPPSKEPGTGAADKAFAALYEYWQTGEYEEPE